LCSLSGMELVVPPHDLLGDISNPSSPERISVWLKKQETGDLFSIVFSVDLLAYGGLVFSRLNNLSAEEAIKNLESMKSLKTSCPGIRMFAFASVLRDGITAVDNNSLDQWKNNMSGNSPTDSDLRSRNIKVLEEIIQWTADGVIDYLHIGKEDTAEGNPNRGELEYLEHLISKSGAQDRVGLCSGTDEMGQLTVARAICEAFKTSPKFCIEPEPTKTGAIPLYEACTIKKSLDIQAFSVSGHVVEDVHNPETIFLTTTNVAEGINDSFMDIVTGLDKYSGDSNIAHVNRIISSLQSLLPQHIGLIDNFMANCSHPLLSSELIQMDMLFRLSSYAGWNTSANSSGTVIAHSAVRACLTESEQSIKSNTSLILKRILDDYVYSYEIRKEIIQEMKVNPIQPIPEGSNELQDVQKFINERLHGYFDENFKNRKFTFGPAGDVSIKFCEMGLEYCVLPWGRLFEVDFRPEFDIEIL